jgi:hypothetical protein
MRLPSVIVNSVSAPLFAAGVWLFPLVRLATHRSLSETAMAERSEKQLL